MRLHRECLRRCLKQGAIFAYPTEAVFGLGCNPFDRQAVARLYRLKKRPKNKSLLLIVDDWRRIAPYTSFRNWPKLESTRVTTWVLPATKKAPPWLLGKGQTIAVRKTNHPLAKHLCKVFKSPLVSTSANPSRRRPAKSSQQVMRYFGGHVVVIHGRVGHEKKPSMIVEVEHGTVIRS
jgi:L-threonylcarbamoyladenylate synthase